MSVSWCTRPAADVVVLSSVSSCIKQRECTEQRNKCIQPKHSSLSFIWHYCHFPCRNGLGMSPYNFLCWKISLPPVVLSVSHKWNRQHDTRLTIKSWHFSSTCKHSAFNSEDNPRIAFHFTLLRTGTSHMQDESVFRKSLHFIIPNTARHKWKTEFAIYPHTHTHTYIYIYIYSLCKCLSKDFSRVTLRCAQKRVCHLFFGMCLSF